MLWNFFEGNVVEIGVLVAIAGFLFESRRRFNKALVADNERHRKALLRIVNAIGDRLERVEEQQKADAERLGRVEEQQREDSERLRRVDERLGRVEEQQKAGAEQLKRVEERQIGGEEHMKGLGRYISALQEDIRAIWQPAVGLVYGKKPDQGRGNHPNDSTPS